MKYSTPFITYDLEDSLFFVDVNIIQCNQSIRLICGSNTSIYDYLLIDDKTCYS